MVLQLLMLKVCGIIGISKIKFFNFCGTERIKQNETKFKDSQREIAPSNKTPALTKSTNISIWVVDTSNRLFIRGS